MVSHRPCSCAGPLVQRSVHVVCFSRVTPGSGPARSLFCSVNRRPPTVIFGGLFRFAPLSQGVGCRYCVCRRARSQSPCLHGRGALSGPSPPRATSRDRDDRPCLCSLVCVMIFILGQIKVGSSDCQRRLRQACGSRSHLQQWFSSVCVCVSIARP